MNKQIFKQSKNTSIKICDKCDSYVTAPNSTYQYCVFWLGTMDENGLLISCKYKFEHIIMRQKDNEMVV